MNGTLAQAERGTHHGRLIGRVLARLYRVRVEGADRVIAEAVDGGPLPPLATCGDLDM